MIARERGGWNGENGRDGEKHFPWITSFVSQIAPFSLSAPSLLSSPLLSPPHTLALSICWPFPKPSFFLFFFHLLFLPPLLSPDLLTEWITDPNSPAHKRLAWMLSSVMDGCSRTMSRSDLWYVVNMFWWKKKKKKHIYSLTQACRPALCRMPMKPTNKYW